MRGMRGSERHKKGVELEMYHKKHNSVLACCDKELSGKTIKKKNGIELEISPSFYGSEPISEKELRETFSEFANINLMGKKAVGAALKEGIVGEKSVLMIGKVPHAIIIRI